MGVTHKDRIWRGICGALMLTALILLIGTAGAVELDTITKRQLITHLCAAFVCAVVGVAGIYFDA